MYTTKNYYAKKIRQQLKKADDARIEAVKANKDNNALSIAYLTALSNLSNTIQRAITHIQKEKK